MEPSRKNELERSRQAISQHWFQSHARFFCLFQRLLLLWAGILAIALSHGARAEVLALQWDPVTDDSLVTGYEVHYGLESRVYQWFVQAEADGAATDTKVVDNLTSGQTYYLAVRARNDGASLVSTFSNEVRATIGSSSDATAPTVSIYASPADPTYTSARTVTLSASATDDVAVTRVEFYDGTMLKGTDTTSPYSYAWSIGSADNGNHTWTAKAFDAAGNAGTASALSLNVAISGGGPDASLGGLVAAYGFEEDQDSMVVVDASGTGNDGILSGATRTTAGWSGSALAFDGTDDRVDLNAMDIGGGDGMTISAWMKADDFGTVDARLVSKATGVQNDDHYWMVSTFSDNSVRFRLKAGGSTTTLISRNDVVNANEWHHVAATYDGARMTLYVDGLEVASTSKSGTIDTNSSVPAAIGSQPQGGKPFDGSLDEVRIYNRAQTAGEIQMDMTIPVAESNPAVPVPTDTTAPTVLIGASPAGPAYTSAQSVTLSATADDDVGVTRVEFYEGTMLKGTDTTQPYSHTWPISNTENGTHRWTAKAFDAAGNSSTSNAVSLDVNIATSPVASFIATTTTAGVAPLTVGVSDTSSGGEITERLWDFGDGQGVVPGASSTSHTYTLPGTYDVSLTVTGPGGTDTATQVGLVTVATDSSPVDPPGDSPEGLIAAYGFEEANDSMVVVDASGTGNDGILSGATRTTAGWSGSALAFDGTDDRVDLNALDIGGGSGLTISLWMKADNFGTYDARLISKATGVQNDDHYWMVSTFSNDSVRFRLKAGGSTTTLISRNGVIAAGKWYHVAATYDGARMTLYVDGMEVASTLKSGTIDTNIGVPAGLGDQPQGGRPFDGSLDEVRIYNRALTVGDIQVEMNYSVADSTPEAPPPTDTAAPTVSISASPAGPAYTSAQSVTLSATADDDVGVTRVEFYEGTTLKGTDTTSPYSYAWIITSADNGNHAWTAKAFDAAGNVGTASALSLNVDILLLGEDFTNGDLSGWSLVDEGTTDGPADWQLIAGELAQLSNVHTLPDEPANLARYGTYLIYEDGYAWSDYRVSYIQGAGDDDALGLMFRVLDADNYYRFSWDRQRGYRRLVKDVNGVFTELAADNVPFVQGQDYQIEIRAQGDQLEVWIDGAPIFQVTDSTHAAGTIAFYTWAMQGGYFDDLLVEDLSGVALNAPPQITAVTATPASILDSAASQLSVTANDPDGGPLGLSYAWTIVSGGGSFDDAVSTTPIYTPANVTGTQSVTLRVDVSDGEDTVSGNVTVLVEDADAPPPWDLLSEDFTSGNLGGWSLIDEGTNGGPADWQVVAGELAQLSNVYSLPHDDPANLARYGTYIIYEDGYAWSDYRASYIQRADDNDALGLMFRVWDGANYYRFSWDRQRGYRRLVKNVNGVFTEIAADNVPFVRGQDYQIGIRAQGDQLEVWIDGALVFQVTDSTHAAGTIAFYTWGMRGGYFDNVLVEDLSGVALNGPAAD